MRTLAERLARLHAMKTGASYAGDQPPVGVRDRVRDRAHRAGVGHQAADIVPARLADLGVLVVPVVERVLSLRPDRLVGVHANRVVAVDRLRHEAADLAVAVGHVLDHVADVLDVVRGRDQLVVVDVDLGLTAGRDLVVVGVHSDVEVVGQDVRHLRPEPDHRIVGRGAVVPLLEPDRGDLGSGLPRGLRLVEQVAGAGPGVPHTLSGGDELDRVEDEVLDLWPPVGGIVPGGREDLLGPPGDPPGVVGVGGGRACRPGRRR